MKRLLLYIMGQRAPEKDQIGTFATAWHSILSQHSKQRSKKSYLFESFPFTQPEKHILSQVIQSYYKGFLNESDFQRILKASLKIDFTLSGDGGKFINKWVQKSNIPYFNLRCLSDTIMKLLRREVRDKSN